MFTIVSLLQTGLQDRPEESKYEETPGGHNAVDRTGLLFIEIVQELRRTRRTKVPVYGQHRDDIIGILYARDLLGIDPENEYIFQPHLAIG